jgi:hypothetical protein
MTMLGADAVADHRQATSKTRTAEMGRRDRGQYGTENSGPNASLGHGALTASAKGGGLPRVSAKTPLEAKILHYQ